MNKKIKCVVMRGGTSRGLFFHRADLPVDEASWEPIFYKAIGTPDPKQVDGLGGGTSSTSKVAIINKSKRPGIDVDYTFVQVGVDKQTLDLKGNCGNISSAVGPFAVDEGLVQAVEPFTEVTIFNTNTGKVMKSKFLVTENKFNSVGTFKLPGLLQKGSEIVMEYLEPGGAITGKLFPTGNKIDRIVIEKKEYWVTVIDCTNTFVLVSSGDLSLPKINPFANINNNSLLKELNTLREYIGRMIGVSGAAFPKISVLTKGKECAINSRTISLEQIHKTIPLTGAFCIAAAALISGTVANKFMDSDSNQSDRPVIIGHLGGTISVKVDIDEHNQDREILKVSASRTARKIMEGYIYV